MDGRCQRASGCCVAELANSDVNDQADSDVNDQVIAVLQSWPTGWAIGLPEPKSLANHGWSRLGNLLDHQIGWPKPMANHGWPEGWAIGLPKPKPLANHG